MFVFAFFKTLFTSSLMEPLPFLHFPPSALVAPTPFQGHSAPHFQCPITRTVDKEKVWIWGSGLVGCSPGLGGPQPIVTFIHSHLGITRTDAPCLEFIT